VAPASKVLGKQEDEVPPDKVNGKKKTTPKSNPYEANPKFPRIFPCKLCPRKFSFVLNLCTHVEIHHRSQFSKIKYGPNKEAAIIHLVQEWVWDIKKEPVILEKEVDEDPDVPEKPPDGGAVVNIVQMSQIVQVVDVGNHGKPYATYVFYFLGMRLTTLKISANFERHFSFIYCRKLKGHRKKK
jgi:hypothetical protein